MITTSTIEHLSRSELESAINTLGDVIAKRQKAFIHNTSALNRHSVIAGFANGSLSITTPQETELMYRLRQALMSHTVSFAREAMQKRRQARRQARQEKALTKKQ